MAFKTIIFSNLPRHSGRFFVDTHFKRISCSRSRWDGLRKWHPHVIMHNITMHIWIFRFDVDGPGSPCISQHFHLLVLSWYIDFSPPVTMWCRKHFIFYRTKSISHVTNQRPVIIPLFQWTCYQSTRFVDRAIMSTSPDIFKLTHNRRCPFSQERLRHCHREVSCFTAELKSLTIGEFWQFPFISNVSVVQFPISRKTTAKSGLPKTPLYGFEMKFIYLLRWKFCSNSIFFCIFPVQ